MDTFHLLAKPTGAICNIDCAYCFYLSKEALYPGSRFRMLNHVLTAYIQQLLDSQSSSEIYLNWQGGEPTLMGLDFYKRTIELVETYKRPDQTIIHTLQTNGTLLNDEWAQFFRQHEFLVGISLDGPEDLHNYYRVDKKGADTFHRVMSSIDHLTNHSVEFNILCTVNAANVSFPHEVYLFFRDVIETQFIQFIPIVEKIPQGIAKHSIVSEQSVSAQKYGDFLSSIFDVWVKSDVGKVFVQDFEVALANWLGVPPSLCVFSETCGQALALEHNGDVYCCDHFVEPEYHLGNIQQTHLSQLVSSQKQKIFGKNKRDLLPAYCLECDVNFACHGGCPKDRFIKTPDGQPNLNYLCEGYKAFFRHISPQMTYMANLIRLGCSPADIIFRPLNSQSSNLRIPSV